MSTEDDVGRVKKVMQALKGDEERVPVTLETKVYLSDQQLADAVSLYLAKDMFPHVKHFWFRPRFKLTQSGRVTAEIIFCGYTSTRASKEQGHHDLDEAEKRLL